MIQVREDQDYAAECLRIAARLPKEREYWLKMAARWAGLANISVHQPQAWYSALHPHRTTPPPGAREWFMSLADD